MLDALLRRLTEPALEAVARRFSANALVFAFAGLALGLAALPAIAMRFYLPALAVVVVSRPVAGVAAAAGRQSGQGDGLVSVFDAICFAGVLFAFALADPSRALAAVFLMFGLTAQWASALALGRAWLGNFEILVAIAIACIFPDRFAIIAYVLGVLCFVAAGARIAALVAQRRIR